MTRKRLKITFSTQKTLFHPKIRHFKKTTLYQEWTDQILPSLERIKSLTDAQHFKTDNEKYELLEKWRVGLENAKELNFARGLKYWQLKRTYDEVIYCEDVIDRIIGDEEDEDNCSLEKLATAEGVKRLIKMSNDLPALFSDIEDEVKDCMLAVAEFKHTCDVLRKGKF